MDFLEVPGSHRMLWFSPYCPVGEPVIGPPLDPTQMGGAQNDMVSVLSHRRDPDVPGARGTNERRGTR